MNAPRHQPFALVLAAHGERRGGFENESVIRLASVLAARGVANEVRYGFIKGEPTVGDALLASGLRDVFIYPLLMSEGYFAGTVLPRLIKEATAARPGLRIQVLPPLGVDPRLADLLIGEVSNAARARDVPAEQVTVVLCAHGSTKDPASRQAAEKVADAATKRQRFAGVRLALLEEPPALDAVVRQIVGPTAVVGLFVGDGLHGGIDVPALVAQASRADVLFAGNVGTFAGLADVVAAAVRRAALRTAYYGDPAD